MRLLTRRPSPHRAERVIVSSIAALAAHVGSGLDVPAALARTGDRLSQSGAEDPDVLEFAQASRRAVLATSLGSSPARVFLDAAAQAPNSMLARLYGELHMCFHLSSRTGLPLADLLEAMADAGQARIDAEECVRSALAGPEATAKLLTWLPLIGAGFGALLLGGAWWETVTSPLGLMAVLLGAVLILGGHAWTAAILRRARRVEVDW